MKAVVVTCLFKTDGSPHPPSNHLQLACVHVPSSLRARNNSLGDGLPYVGKHCSIAPVLFGRANNGTGGQQHSIAFPCIVAPLLCDRAKDGGTQLPDQGGQLTDHFRGNKDFWRCPTFLTLAQQSTCPHLSHFAV